MNIAGSAVFGLWRFLAVSLALHALLLSMLRADVQPLPGDRAMLSVTVAPSGPGRPAGAPEEAVAERALRTATRAKPVDTRARNSAVPDSHAAVALVPENRVMPQSIQSGTGRNAIAGEAAASALSPPEGASIDAVRQYVLLLVPEVRRLKRYPALARERGWEGTAEISIRLARGQSAPSLSVSRSSGYPVLDDQALAMIDHAVRTVAVPDLLQGRDVAIPVPIRFSLED